MEILLRRKLDVSGKLYTIDNDVLIKCKYFSDLIAASPGVGLETPYYICRSSLLFDHVLAYMIDPDYLYPFEAENEIKYFQLEPTKKSRDHLRGPPGERGSPGARGVRGAPGDRGPRGADSYTSSSSSEEEEPIAIITRDSPLFYDSSEESESAPPSQRSSELLPTTSWRTSISLSPSNDGVMTAWSNVIIKT